MKNKAKKLQGSISKINIKKTVSMATHRNKLLAVQKTGLGYATENGPNKGIMPKLDTGKGQHVVKPTRNRQQVNVSKKEIEKESSKGKEQVMVQHRATKQRRENNMSNKKSKSDNGQKLNVQNPKEPTPSLESETARKEHDHDYTGDVSKKMKSKKEETTSSVRKTKQLQQTKNDTSTTTRPTSKDGSGLGESEKEKSVKLDQPTPNKVGDEEHDEISEEYSKIMDKKVQPSSAKQRIELKSKSKSNERLRSDDHNDRSIKRANRNDDESSKKWREEVERKPHDQKAETDEQTNHELNVSNRTKNGKNKPSPTTPDETHEKEKLDHKKAKSKKTPLVAEKPYEWGPGRPIQYPKSMTVDNEESDQNIADIIKIKKSDSDSPEGPSTSEL